MPDRKPEPWETGAAGPSLWVEGSPVEVWALGGGRFSVRVPEYKQLVTGYEEARPSRAGSR